MEDELLDLVNNNDEIIGSVWRSKYNEIIEKKLGNIRAVEMLIQNDEGQLWIPKRTAEKRIAPNGLDYSMGGHVSSGETYIQSALREIKEELNLNLSHDDLIFVKKFSPSDLPYFRVLYIYKSNTAPSYNPNDFVSAEWLLPSELIARLDSGVFAKTNMRETISALL
ncbi:NUDIX domain-containing protein [Candidatus Saccharibacteria bacterium]|nr:NUDIX domain-containing protein [Candidatus Saccharibacteria bacterium]